MICSFNIFFTKNILLKGQIISLDFKLKYPDERKDLAIAATHVWGGTEIYTTGI
jgi:hypothetical protein